MADANGSMWVEGNYLYWMNAANTRFRFLGTTVATPGGALPGSQWVEANTVHYIDSSGVERYVDGPAVGATPGLAGSIWIDGAHAPSNPVGQFHWLGDTGHEFYAHNDVTHTDTHTDVTASHTDAPAGSSHTDTPAGSSHTDATPYTNSHADSYSSNHTDDPLHTDAFEPLGHYDFGDHYDGHADSYSNSHTDATSPYTNSHTDTPYSNSHTDTPHGDSTTPHTDTHTDVPHVDNPQAV